VEVAFAQAINGLATGSIYALLTTGFNLLLLVGGVFQFAYPHLVVVTMYILWLLLGATNNNLALSIPAAIGSGLGLSLATEPIFRPLARRGAKTPSLILSLGIAIIILDFINRQLNRGVPIGFPIALSGEEALARFGIATITAGQLATILGSVGFVTGFLYLLYRTRQGRGLRALAQNPWTARLLGIPVARLNLTGYILAGLLAGISAVFLAMSLGAASAPLAGILAVKVLAVAIFAGLGNLRGGLICGVILGMAESFATGNVPGDWVNAIAFGMILIAVIWRPEGVFGLRA
jgi:branched-chain amino acid transport system permease protein